MEIWNIYSRNPVFVVEPRQLCFVYAKKLQEFHVNMPDNDLVYVMCVFVKFSKNYVGHFLHKGPPLVKKELKLKNSIKCEWIFHLMKPCLCM